MKPDMQFIERECRSARADGVLRGVTIAAGTKNSLDLLESWGNASESPVERRMQENSIFDIASLTKVVATASACAICIDRGLLDPEAPARHYLPGLEELEQGTTRICDLATHCSGYDNRKFDTEMPEKILSAIMHAPAQWPPQKRYEYSCRNFILLGLIVESVVGRPLAAFCQEAIFGPLGMNDTAFGPIKAGLKRVVPTTMPPGVISDAQARKAPQPVGNAGVFSSAPDLALFCQMMLQGGVFVGRRIIGSEGFAWLTRPCTPEGLPQRSFAWDMRSCSECMHRPTALSESAIGHSGWTGQSMWIDPERGAYVLVLTNRTHGRAPSAPDNYEASMRFRARIANAAVTATGA